MKKLKKCITVSTKIIKQLELISSLIIRNVSWTANQHIRIISKNHVTITNQIKSLLLSHHHSTSALVSEILMSVLQTVQKNNKQLHMDRQCKKKQQTIYIWTDSAKKNNKQFTYGQTVQKLHWSIYSAPDSAKKTTTAIYIWTDSAKKKQQQFTYGQTVQKKTTAITYGQTVQKKQQQFTYGQTVQKKQQQLHMDSTYLQTVQKTMCKIHIHALSTLSVL